MDKIEDELETDQSRRRPKGNLLMSGENPDARDCFPDPAAFMHLEP